MATSWGGIGKAQRNWVLERDNHRCQMFRYDDDKDKWVQCPNTNDLHVH